MTLGEIAYKAYCSARNWKSFNNDPLPSFDEMKSKNPEIALAWEKAANAVAIHIDNQTSQG